MKTSHFLHTFGASALIFVFGLLAFAQTTEKKVKWVSLRGENNEFFILIPEGFLLSSYKPPALENRTRMLNGNQVDEEITVSRFINGTLLLFEYYEGGVKGIRETLLTWRNAEVVKEEPVNGFQCQQIKLKKDIEGLSRRIQSCLIKNRLYIFQAISKTTDDEIVKIFFDSVRLTNQNQTVALNVPAIQNASIVAFPKDISEKTEIYDFTEKLRPDDKTVTRPFVMIKNSRPALTGGFNQGSATLEVLFGASGKVEEVKVIKSQDNTFEISAINAAKRIVFIPAEKNGKFVSQYKKVVFTYSNQ